VLRLLVGRLKKGGEDSEGEDDEHVKLSGAKGAEALARYVRLVERQPERVSAAVLCNAAAELGIALPQIPRLRTYLEQKVAFGNLRTLTFSAFLMAAVADAANSNQPELSRALANLGVAAYEQCALEGGSNWTIPWLLTTVPEPPWALVQRTLQGSILHPHSKLLDPRWAVAVGGYVADTVKLQERLSKDRPRAGKDGADPPPKAKSRAKAKAKAKAKEGGADGPPK